MKKWPRPSPGLLRRRPTGESTYGRARQKRTNKKTLKIRHLQATASREPTSRQRQKDVDR
ncbi:hypothetical protein RB213_013396 [Colletotrichum asianum]